MQYFKTFIPHIHGQIFYRNGIISSTLTDQDQPIVHHIDENCEEMTQEQIIDRITGQMNLFEDETFHLEKKASKTHILPD